MEKDTLQLALTVGGKAINPPSGVPTGGLDQASTIISNALTILLSFGVILAVGVIVYGGFMYTMSRGEKEAVEKAKRMIVYALIGLSLTFLAFLVINVLGSFFGDINLLNITL